MIQLILKLREVGKKFTLKNGGSLQPTFLTILKTILGFRVHITKSETDYWALRDINMELIKGESIGIVGLNGAGKSTLLKLLLKRLVADEGTIERHGSIGGLIELGAGFHPEQTGRKNIYVNARLNGATDKEINAKLDSIIKFSELDEFIDMPVKTYSSGMTIRLGFSIAVHFVKDLIVLDEVLAVGDFEFKQKCHRLIHKLKREKSFVLVSHNTRDISLFCDKAIFLHKGRIIKYGDVEEVMKTFSIVRRNDSYEDLISRIEEKREKTPETNVDNQSYDILNNSSFSESEEYRINKFGRIYHNRKIVDNVKVYSSRPLNNGELYLDNTDDLTIKVEFNLKVEVSHVRIGLPFFAENGDMIIGPDSRRFTMSDKNLCKPGAKIIYIKLNECPFNEGRYYVCLAINNDPGFLFREHLVWINIKNTNGSFGKVKTNLNWSYETI